MSAKKRLTGVSVGQQTPMDFSKSSDYEKLCWAIKELEMREERENTVDVRKVVNAALQRRLVKLIGSKPIFKCVMNEVDSSALWDSGSQISVVDEEWVSNNAPNAELRPVSDFVEGELHCKTANNTEMPMLGIVMIDVTIGETALRVPFLVSI